MAKLETKQLEDMIRRLHEADEFSLDLETTGLDPLKDRITGFSFATSEKRAWWVPVVGDDALRLSDLITMVKPILDNEAKTAWLQNAKFDLQYLTLAGIELKCKMGDTMVAAWLMDENRAKRRGSLRLKGENGLVAQEFDVVLPEYSRSQMGGDLFGKADDEYATDDTKWTLKLGKHLLKKLEKDGLTRVFWDLEMPITRLVAEMEMAGLTVNLPFLWELQKRYDAEAKQHEKRVQEIVKERCTVGSPEQMSRLLFGKLGLQPFPWMEKNAKGLYSTDEEVLSEYADECEVADLILQYREASMYRDRYIRPLIELGSADPERRVRTNFYQCGTETGRFSSSDPNLQNIPKEGDVRKAFVAAEGCTLIVADYNQLELRLMAHFSQDPEMLRVYRNNEDIHAKTMKELGIPERKVAKESNFGLIYGMGAERFKKQLWKKARIRKSLDDCLRWRYGFFELYRKIQPYHRKIEAEIEENGYVKSLCGRLRRLKRWLKADSGKAYRIGVNFTIQGSAADLMLLAMRNFQKTLLEKRALGGQWKKVRQLVQVHDELVVEAPDPLAVEVAEMVKVAMESVVKLSVPLIANVGSGKTWAEGKG